MYVQTGFRICLYKGSLLWRDSEEFLPISQDNFLDLRSSSSRFFLTWAFHRSLASKVMSWCKWNMEMADSMEYNPSWEASSFSPSKQHILILCKLNIRYRICKSSPPIPLLSQTAPVHALAFYFVKIHFNIFFPCRVDRSSPHVYRTWPCMTLYDPVLSPIRATCPVCLIVLELIARILHIGDMRWRSCLRHCATSRKVAGSIPYGVIGILYWHNPSGRTMTLGFTQPLTEMSTRNISWGWRRPVRRADNLTTFICRLSWNLGTSTSWNPQGLSRHLTGLLYLYLLILYISYIPCLLEWTS